MWVRVNNFRDFSQQKLENIISIIFSLIKMIMVIIFMIIMIKMIKIKMIMVIIKQCLFVFSDYQDDDHDYGHGDIDFLSLNRIY